MNAQHESLARDELISSLIDAGTRLKNETLSRMQEWEPAVRTTIHGSLRLSNDLEHRIKRWFNEVDSRARDSLNYSKDALTYTMRHILDPLGAEGLVDNGFGIVLSSHTFERLLREASEGFDYGIDMLETLPISPKIGPPHLPTSIVQPNTAFILMWMIPQKPELEDVLNAFKDVFAEFGVKALRADDIEHPGAITELVLSHIRESEFVIADLTGGRPNVYYEVGYAEAMGKLPILSRKKGTPLHFNLKVHKVLEYGNITELKVQLRKSVEAKIRERSSSAKRD